MTRDFSYVRISLIHEHHQSCLLTIWQKGSVPVKSS